MNDASKYTLEFAQALRTSSLEKIQDIINLSVESRVAILSHLTCNDSARDFFLQTIEDSPWLSWGIMKTFTDGWKQDGVLKLNNELVLRQFYTQEELFEVATNTMCEVQDELLLHDAKLIGKDYPEILYQIEDLYNIYSSGFLANCQALATSTNRLLHYSAFLSKRKLHQVVKTLEATFKFASEAPRAPNYKQGDEHVIQLMQAAHSCALKLRLSGAPSYSKAFLDIVWKAFNKHDNALKVLFSSTGDDLQDKASADMMVKMLKMRYETKKGKLHRPELTPPPPRCSACDTLLTKPLSCGRCKTVRYCSRNCQVKAWKMHKKSCKPYQPPTRRAPPCAHQKAAVASKSMENQISAKFQEMMDQVLKAKGGGVGNATDSDIDKNKNDKMGKGGRTERVGKPKPGPPKNSPYYHYLSTPAEQAKQFEPIRVRAGRVVSERTKWHPCSDNRDYTTQANARWKEMMKEFKWPKSDLSVKSMSQCSMDFSIHYVRNKVKYIYDMSFTLEWEGCVLGKKVEGSLSMSDISCLITHPLEWFWDLRSVKDDSEHTTAEEIIKGSREVITAKLEKLIDELKRKRGPL